MNEHDSRVAVRGTGALVDGLLDGLTALGWSVAEEGACDALVVVPPVAGSDGPIEAITDAEFEAAWEVPLRTTVEAMLAARLGGAKRMLIVTSTLGMTGAELGAPASMSAEAMRALAKSAARQWGPEGITVNALTVDPSLLGIDAGTVSLAPRALGGPGEPATELAPLVAFCCSPESRHLTGATLCADGGSWMH